MIVTMHEHGRHGQRLCQDIVPKCAVRGRLFDGGVAAESNRNEPFGEQIDLRDERGFVIWMKRFVRQKH